MTYSGIEFSNNRNCMVNATWKVAGNVGGATECGSELVVVKFLMSLVWYKQGHVKVISGDDAKAFLL